MPTAESAIFNSMRLPSPTLLTQFAMRRSLTIPVSAAPALTAAAAIFYERFKDSRVMQDVMAGVRPVCVGMIFGVALELCASNYLAEGRVLLPYVILGAADLFLLLKVKLSIPKLIGLNALAGMLLFGVLGM